MQNYIARIDPSAMLDMFKGVLSVRLNGKIRCANSRERLFKGRIGSRAELAGGGSLRSIRELPNSGRNHCEADRSGAITMRATGFFCRRSTVVAGKGRHGDTETQRRLAKHPRVPASPLLRVGFALCP